MRRYGGVYEDIDYATYIGNATSSYEMKQRLYFAFFMP